MCTGGRGRERVNSYFGVGKSHYIKKKRPFDGERIVFSTSSTETTGYLQAKEQAGPVLHLLHQN